jgi:hypothetical protein
MVTLEEACDVKQVRAILNGMNMHQIATKVWCLMSKVRGLRAALDNNCTCGQVDSNYTAHEADCPVGLQQRYIDLAKENDDLLHEINSLRYHCEQRLREIQSTMHKLEAGLA